MANLIEAWDGNLVRVIVKFEPSIAVSSIKNERFTLWVIDEDATPTETLVDAEPFKNIDLAEDYSSIAKRLTLWWNTGVLQTGTKYKIKFTGLRTASGTVIEEDAIVFRTGDSVDPNPDDIPPEPESWVIEDYSSIPELTTDTVPTVVVGENTPDATPSYISVTESDPIDGDAYLPEGYKNGALLITFSNAIDSGFFTTDYFIAQKREIKRGPTRWEEIDIQVDPHPTDDKSVYIYFPSDDATPTYNQADGAYFKENTKYRVKILPGITSGSLSLLDPVFITFAGIIDPLYIDPSELEVLFPEATYLEIAEAIHYASLFIQQSFKIPVGSTPTSWAMYDYVKAAAACALSRIHGNESLVPNSSNASSIALGDLRVEYSRGVVNPSGKVSAATASTWCELAEAIKLDLLHSSVGVKAVVKGSRYLNPIPDRKLKSFKSKSEIVYAPDKLQGLLDGPG